MSVVINMGEPKIAFASQRRAKIDNNQPFHTTRNSPQQTIGTTNNTLNAHSIGRLGPNGFSSLASSNYNEMKQERPTSFSFIPSLLVHHADNTENYSIAIFVRLLLTFCRAAMVQHQDNTLMNSPTWLRRHTHPSNRRGGWQTVEFKRIAVGVVVRIMTTMWLC